jgi:hypothetical protein
MTSSRSSRFRKSPSRYAVGQWATMLFHMYGLVSEAPHKILEVKRDGSITLDTDEDISKCFRFDTRTGKCLNDNTWGNAKRTLRIDP